MELSSVLSTSSNQSRLSNDRRSSLGIHHQQQFHARRIPGFASSTVTRATMGDFKDQQSSNENTPTRPRYQEEISRRKLEMMGGLLRERYGVGALVTAGMIKGINMTGDLIRGIRTRSLTNQNTRVVRRNRVKEKTDDKPLPESTMTEKLQSAVSDSLALPITWIQKDEMNSDESLFEEAREFVEEAVVEEVVSSSVLENPEKSTNEVVGMSPEDPEDDPEVEEPETEEIIVRIREPEYIPVQEKEKSQMNNPVIENQLENPGTETNKQPVEKLSAVEDEEIPEVDPVMFVEEEKVKEEETRMDKVYEDEITAEERRNIDIVGKYFENLVDDPVSTSAAKADSRVSAQNLSIKEEGMSSLRSLENSETESTHQLAEDSETESSPAMDDAEEMTEKNNIETFSKVEDQDENTTTSSAAKNRALEILNEMAVFESETGESFDSTDLDFKQPISLTNTSPPVPNVPEESQRSHQEIRKDMEKETRKRLEAMKKENQTRRTPIKRVEVKRPSKNGSKFLLTPSEMIRPASHGLKGLDYIKSYARSSQDQLENEYNDETENTENSSSGYFPPPSILQDGGKAQTTPRSSTTGGGYSHYNEVDRLQKVREIGTVLWLGRGGNGGSGGGGNGGSGGGRGGPGGSNDGYSDKDWWIQVGVSLLTMAGLVFVLLRTISERMEKQSQPKKSELNG